jgi:chromosome segregation ATPase
VIQLAWHSYLRKSREKGAIEDFGTVVSEVSSCTDENYLLATRNHATLLPPAYATENTTASLEARVNECSSHVEVAQIATLKTSNDSSECSFCLQYISNLEKKVGELQEKCMHLEQNAEDNDTKMKQLKYSHRVTLSQNKHFKIEARKDKAEMKRLRDDTLAAQHRIKMLENELRQILLDIRFFRKSSKHPFESRSINVTP